MGTSDDTTSTLAFTCPSCHATSTMPRKLEGQFMPCPRCGISVAIVEDPPQPPDIRTLASAVDSNLEALQEQNRRSREYAHTHGFKRVAFRVFRLHGLETWESLFERAAEFASQLPPAALINISHSSGDAIGANSATVWYWEVVPVKIDEFEV